MKPRESFLRAVSIVLAASVLFTSCVSTTLIRSNPEGARLTLNGEAVGTTPYRHSDTRIVGTTNSLVLEKEGYETLYASFSRDEEVDIGAIVAGFFVWVPFLWIMKYKPIHAYELKQAAPVLPTDAGKIEKLKELRKMYEEKLITEQEYESARKRILEMP